MSDLESGLKFRYNAFSFTGPGGEQFDAEKYKDETLRADLVEVANRVSFEHGPRIVDLILGRFDVSRKL